jgi:ABC-type sugar transport system ATPase subunit
MSEPVLSIRGLTKRFGGLTAVNDVSLDIHAGEVVALLGDNGAGKSTLIKCVSGVHRADEGEIRFEGRPVSFARPIDARGGGIETIYQDLALANNLDVPSNIFLGRETKRRYFGGLVQTLDDRSMLREAEQSLAALDIVFPTLTQPIESLSGGQRQAVAIARAIYWKARLMIMDEPTNNLGVPEQHKVLELIRRLRDQGVPVVLITHTMPDVFAVADRVVVMHRGRKVTEKAASATDATELVQYMVGALDDGRGATSAGG